MFLTLWLADPPQSNVNPRDSPDVVEEFDLFANDPVTPVRPQNRQLPSSPQNIAVSQQAVLDPGIFHGTTCATPRVSEGQSSNEVAQNAATTLPQSFHPPGFAPVPVVASPQLAELAVANLPMATNDMVPSATAVSGPNPTESALVQQLLAEVTTLTNALQSQQQQLQQMQQQQSQQLATAPATLPIAPPCVPPKGAAPSAPARSGHASLAGTPCANSRFGSIGRAPPPQQVLPPGLPPLPLAQQVLL